MRRWFGQSGGLRVHIFDGEVVDIHARIFEDVISNCDVRQRPEDVVRLSVISGEERVCLEPLTNFRARVEPEPLR